MKDGVKKKKKFMKHYAVIKENYRPLAVVTPGVCIYVGLSLSVHIVHHQSFQGNSRKKSNWQGYYYSVSFKVFLMIMRYFLKKYLIYLFGCAGS